MTIKSKDITAKDIKKLLLNVYKRYTRGTITDTQAQRQTFLLNSVLKAIEVTDLEGRIQQIENTIKND